MSKESAKLLTIRSKIISLSGKTYSYYLIIAASLAAFYNIYFIILAVFLIYKFRKHFKIKILMILGTLIVFSFGISQLKQIGTIKTELEGSIVEISEKRNEIIMRKGLNYYLIKSNKHYEVGDIIRVKGIPIEPDGVRTPHGFNLKNYYQSKNIISTYNNPEIMKINNNYGYFINGLIYKYLNTFPQLTSTYLKAMILGINEYELDFKNATKMLQISYIINLSGILIYAVINLLRKLFYYLDVNISSQEVVIVIILCLWGFVTNFKFVISRILIAYIINIINRRWGLKLTRLDKVFYTFLILIIINYQFIYSLGFSLSFIILTVMALDNQKRRSNFLASRYQNYLLGYLWIFPLLINMNNQIYFLVFLVTPIIILMFQKGLVYVLLVVLIMPFLSPIVEYYLYYLELGIKLVSSLKISINFPSFDDIFIVMYFLILLVIFTSKKKLIIMYLLMLLFVVYNKSGFDPTYRLYFLDVGQGDTTIFITPFSEEVVVVDAYGDVYDVLTKLGIRKIDYLILTHPDNDHVREANTIIDNLSVFNTVINPYDDYKISTDNLLVMQSDDYVTRKKFSLQFYGPIRDYFNSNDNSLVFKLAYLDNSVMFLGDISKTTEIEIVNKYRPLLKSNVLKLAHHGSNTSTSLELLNAVRPQDIIISVGKNNTYGFPHLEVLSKLTNKYQIYRTDINHTISYIHLNKWLNLLKHYQNYINYYIIDKKKRGVISWIV